MESVSLLDCAGGPRSAATLASFHQGRPPRNKGLRYPPDPPTVEEIIAVMRAAGDRPEAVRLRGVMIMLWRAGLRISEALALTETDLDPVTGAVLIRRGKGGKRREVGLDRRGWEHLDPWLKLRASFPVGALFCVLRGPTSGRPCAPAGIRAELRHAATAAGVPVDLRPTNSDMPMPSRCPAKASRSWSSSASWGMPTWRSPPDTSAASTTRRSSGPSTSAQRP